VEPALQAGTDGGRARGVARRVPRIERERQMLDVAEVLFAERGFAVSMDEIADGAGITKPMLYAYFDSKEGLYRSCVERVRGRLQEAIEGAATADEDAATRLWRALLAFFTFVDEERAAWTVFHGEAAAEGGLFAEEVARCRRDNVSLVARQLGAAGLRGEARDGSGTAADNEQTALMLVGACETLASWWLDHPGEPKEALALRVMNVFWLGLGAVGEGTRWRPPAAVAA